MMRVLNLVLIVITFGAIVTPAQNPDFNRLQLSPKGRAAYERLVSACVFRIGPVGYAAVTSQEELALYDLLEEANGLEAFKSLVAVGSYEGGLYGLVGLSLQNHGEFNRAVEIYKARKDERRRPQTKWIECNIVDTPEYVATQSGCILGRELRAKTVTEIQSGRYDTQVEAKYRPRR